jgi:hypothetical protein
LFFVSIYCLPQFCYCYLTWFHRFCLSINHILSWWAGKFRSKILQTQYLIVHLRGNVKPTRTKVIFVQLVPFRAFCFLIVKWNTCNIWLIYLQFFICCCTILILLFMYFLPSHYSSSLQWYFFCKIGFHLLPSAGTSVSGLLILSFMYFSLTHVSTSSY